VVTLLKERDMSRLWLCRLFSFSLIREMPGFAWSVAQRKGRNENLSSWKYNASRERESYLNLFYSGFIPISMFDPMEL
jgi:hypothetical protein